MSDLPAMLDLSEKQLEQMDNCLSEMYWETEARCILLADISGQLIVDKGATNRMNMTVLSALAAGELAATKELARLVGEPARFKLLLHEGEHQCVYISDVGEEMILVTVFDTSTAIGLVRLYTRKVVGELLQIVSSPDDAAKPGTEMTETDEALLDDDLGLLLGSEFDSVFGGS
jgi:predicted regulator of Ras-like GTPase activity (Roadblock/LC7/MglB family)